MNKQNENIHIMNKTKDNLFYRFKNSTEIDEFLRYAKSYIKWTKNQTPYTGLSAKILNFDPNTVSLSVWADTSIIKDSKEIKDLAEFLEILESYEQ